MMAKLWGEVRLALTMVCLLLPHFSKQASRYGCPCSLPSPSDKFYSREEFIEATSTRPYELSCCPHHLLNTTTQTDIDIIWSFKGVQYPWGRVLSSFQLGYCGKETLESDSAQLVDDGQFLCSLTSPPGHAFLNKTFTICVNRNDELRGPPVMSSITDDSWALRGEQVTFNCSAFVGRDPCRVDSATSLHEDITWTKETTSGKWVNASHLRNVKIIKSKDEEGTVRSQLMVRAVEPAHYGRHRCTVTNTHGSSTFDVTLQEGVDPSERGALGYRAALVVMVAAALCFTLSIFLWKRCHLAFAFYFRGIATGGTDVETEDGQVDVMIVHGDSASHWVWSVLLPLLEDTCHYTCFLPQRDMLAGDLILEEVASRVWRCRRVLVVVTPCLTQCPWAAWALHHGLQASLNARTRLLALTLQDITAGDPNLPDPTSILKSLKLVRSLRVPTSCGLKALDTKEVPAYTTYPHLSEDEWKGGKKKTEGQKEISWGEKKKILEEKKSRGEKASWGEKEKGEKKRITNVQMKEDTRKDSREINRTEKREKEHWKKEMKNKKSRLEVPTLSHSRIKSRSRSRSRSPLECTWPLIEEEEEQMQNNFTSGSAKIMVERKKIKEEAKQHEVTAVETLRLGLKLSLPELTQPPGTHFLGSQRVSNMRAASRESLEPKKYETREDDLPLTEGLQDPGSPCSITPFILTPSHPSLRWRRRSVCESLRLVFTGDKELFWNTLIYRLGPPAARPLKLLHKQMGNMT